MKKTLAIAGALLLIGGCFFPIMNIGIEPFNFFSTAPTNVADVPKYALIIPGCVLAAIAIASAILGLMNKTKFLWVTGTLALVITSVVFAGIHFKIESMKEDINSELEKVLGPLLNKSVLESLFQPVHQGGAGWYLIGAGITLLILSSLLKIKKNNTINASPTA